MALYGNIENPYQRAMGQVGGLNTAAAQGAETTVKAKTSKAMNSINSGLAGLDAFGEGNPVAGAVGSAFGPAFPTAASIGYESGKKADNPWEAFISGGLDANEKGMLPIKKNGQLNPAHLIPQDPVNNMIGGGIAGLAGFLF